MKDSIIHSRAEQMLRRYESIGNIEPSPDWELSLNTRYQGVRSKSTPTGTGSKPGYALIILIFIIFNAGFFLAIMIHDFGRPVQRYEKLQVISNELMINPTSSNN